MVFLQSFQADFVIVAQDVTASFQILSILLSFSCYPIILCFIVLNLEVSLNNLTKERRKEIIA
jgi:hypothetical protein